jgi:hypothetical protein
VFAAGTFPSVCLLLEILATMSTYESSISFDWKIMADSAITQTSTGESVGARPVLYSLSQMLSEF